ncbi:DeoR/GlpR family DNA-binding transcription regulator [Leuconostoc citreum]
MNSRRYDILELVDQKGYVANQELADKFNISLVTIRKDLKRMEDFGLIKRTHGGASLEGIDQLHRKMVHNYRYKVDVVRKAINLIQEDDVILLDEGSTNALLAKVLLTIDKRLHIITNSLDIAQLIIKSPNIQLTVVGGTLQSQSRTLVGPLANYALNKINVDKAFISASGYSLEMGFTCNDFSQIEFVRNIAQARVKICVLVDQSKFKTVGTTTLLDLSDINYIVTNNIIDENILQQLKQKTTVLI